MKLTALCASVLLLASVACAEEQAIAVNAYFSKDDPHWPTVEKMVDAAAAKYSRLRVNKIDIDTPQGYKLLHALEKISSEPPGDLTVTIEHVTLTSTGERRDVEKYFDAVIARILGQADIKGKKPVDAAAYAVEIFGKDAKVVADGVVDPEQDDQYFRVKREGQSVGWVIDAYHKIDCPVCSDAQFLLAVKSPELTIVDMRPVRELELRGIKAGDAVSQPFLTQFKGRAAREGERRIDALSGATKTTFAYQTTVNEVLQELQKREKK